MPDDKRGREKQARNANRRQREHAIAAELEQMDDPEPAIDEGELAFFETALEELEFPATGTEIVSSLGHRELDVGDESYSVSELVPTTDSETFEDPTNVRVQVQRPTVAKAIKRIVEATDAVPDTTLSGSKRTAYEKTFRKLLEIDAVYEDGGMNVVTDWVISELQENGTLPGSREIRRRAGKYCRDTGYEIRNDEWLDI
ncbi:DUF5789 family protein [Halodesulfurarchaeum sp.]|uniref:DUF5789 family protein n=1 Tax=Halodesulfurarchaeum sp. TaxID=1980530 RepID=UPI001BBA4811|nr:hypothetical protein [Halodesulfurarchaeum sp.]